MKKFALLLLSLTAMSSSAAADGFTIERYEPTGAGQWSFFVDHPWYTRSRYFAAVGLTLDYAHQPFRFYMTDAANNTTTTSIVGHQLVAHVDAAVSFLDRISIAASLPIVYLERGTAAGGVAPLGGGAAGDPRIGAMVRLWKQPLADAFSIHAGFDLWIPIGATVNHAGDSTVRFMPKLVLAGLTHRILWSFLFGFQYRPDASIGNLPAGSGNTVGSELKIGAAIAYADLPRRFSVGPELAIATVATGSYSFGRSTSSAEVLLGGHYNIAKQIEAGLALGFGFLTEPGTPDFRMIFRIAYSPMRPELPEPVAECAPLPPPPPPPPNDRDHDGVIDSLDLCPDEPAGAHPDPKRPGCPDKDSDGDGIYDSQDLCPAEPAGDHPDPKRLGCPDKDSDGDGIYDSQDLCPTEPAGLQPDPTRAGCPLPDRDRDTVPDAVDACPDEPGAPNPDPKKNGCPGLVAVRNGQIVIMQPVFFATNKDVILAKSFPVLQAVADALLAQTAIKHLSVEGHTDNRGKPAKNLDLSQRRAESVKRFLIEHGVDAERLEAHGYGDTKPVAPNTTDEGRAANRRVEFRIIQQ